MSRHLHSVTVKMGFLPIQLPLCHRARLCPVGGAGLCSNMARWMDLVAVGWIALQMTGSPFMVAVAAFARSAPMMVLGPFVGIVADRVSRAHLLLVTQAGGTVIALTFLVMFAVDAARSRSPTAAARRDARATSAPAGRRGDRRSARTSGPKRCYFFAASMSRIPRKASA